MKHETAWLGSLACLFGLVIAIRDVAAVGDDAPMLTLLLLMGCSGLLGFVRPGRAWQWALLVGVWLAPFHLAVRGLGLDEHFQPDTVPARLALLPLSLAACLVGAYAGVLTRHILLSTDDARR